MSWKVLGKPLSRGKFNHGKFNLRSKREKGCNLVINVCRPQSTVQKFKFCGKLDCPDWILAELFYASHLEAKKFKLICENVRETILADGNFDQDSLEHLGLDELAFDIDDARACFGAVNYIMTSACLYQVPTTELGIELEQLGLPEEHCQLLCQVMEASLGKLKEHIK